MKMSLIYMSKKFSFSYERMSTKTRFEEEAKGNSEMAYSGAILPSENLKLLIHIQCWCEQCSLTVLTELTVN